MARTLRPFRLEVFFSKWEFTARYHLCASDMQSMTLTELLQLATPEDAAAWENLHLGYTETYGRPSLRAAIAGTYDKVEPADVLVFAGAQEGIYAAAHALLTPTDHAITLTPNYQSVESVPLSICEVTGVPLDAEKNWDVDLDRLRDSIRRNTRVIFINFPNNPTGKVISHGALQAIIEMCRKQGIYLFSDEVYRLIERRPQMTLPQAADIYERGLSLGVMSKAYGFPGLRIGWIASKDREALSKIERVKHYTSICNSAPSEMLAQIALKARDRILERNRGIIEKNLPLLEKFFEKQSRLFEWYLPDGGCVGYPRYLGAGGVESFCQQLVEESGVLLLPASVFQSELGPVPNDRFRIGYGRANMPECLEALEKHLRV